MGREPCSGYEPIVADRLEPIMPSEGITPGRRECHDAQPGRRHVDYVYPDARPRPLALEVTSIVAEVELKAEGASSTLGGGLTEIAEAEHLGAWLVNIDAEHRFRDMEPEIAKIIRDAQVNRERLLREDGFIRPGWYTFHDLQRLPTREWDPFMAEHERLKQLGIIEVKPIRATRENGVMIMVSRSAEGFGSFREELDGAMARKIGTLRREHDLERHLGVYLRRWDRSSEPEDTPVPEIAYEIDVLWVVHAWRREAFDYPPLWVARRGETAWRVYD